jgi:hypothetical protein
MVEDAAEGNGDRSSPGESITGTREHLAALTRRDVHSRPGEQDSNVKPALRGHLESAEVGQPLLRFRDRGPYRGVGAEQDVPAQRGTPIHIVSSDCYRFVTAAVRS